MRLPEVLGVGPPRTGTTWLHNVLEGHVDLPYGVKETLYFTTFYGKGLDWYARHFRYATGARKVVEICPYFFDTETLDRIKTVMPHCKIITTMRDPVDRLYSMYKTLRYSAETRRGTFEQTLDAWPSMAKGNRYASHLKGWFDTFGRENVLVTMYDELRADPQAYVNRVTDFIGIERIELSAHPQIADDVNAFRRAPKNPRLARKAWRFKYWLKGHQAYGVVNLLERTGVWDFCGGRGEPYQPLTPEQDARLRARYLPEVEALEEMLMIDLSAWKKPRGDRPVENSVALPLQTARQEMSANVKRRLPEIIGAGPGRTGTTWLHRVLEGHVDLPYGVKETQFFNTFYDKGIDWYARHFRYATGERKIVEICPYFFYPQAPERIKLHIPNCRIITTLRDPVEHTFSAYKLVLHFAWAHGSFDQVLKTRPNLGGGNRYASVLKTWFDLFGRENVLVTMYDELRAQPQSYLDRVTDFMGVERIPLAARREIGDDVFSFARAPKSRKLARNARKLMYWMQGRQAYGTINLLEGAGVWDFCYGRGEPFGRMTAEQEQSLRERYLPEVEALEELLGIDLSAWKKPQARRASA